MPRRNRRPMAQPVDLTPPPPAFIPLGQRPAALRNIKSRQEQEDAQADRQRSARMRDGIDWKVCLVPGCGRELYLSREGSVPDHMRDVTVYLPICIQHAAVVARNFKSMWPEDESQPALAAATESYEDQQAQILRRSIVNHQGGEGIIYMLKQNGLIKVGWSSDIQKRLRAYGPSVDILATFPGSRADETTLHRQLRSELAKGREWYHDSAVLQHFISEAVARHGQPIAAHLPVWTQPKEPVIKARNRR